jgi:Fe-S cluster assembly ATPase SufC
MSAGRIIKSGDKALALELESRGYDWLLDDKKAWRWDAAPRESDSNTL